MPDLLAVKASSRLGFRCGNGGTSPNQQYLWIYPDWEFRWPRVSDSILVSFPRSFDVCVYSMYGMTLQAAYRYFRSYPADPLRLKGMVCIYSPQFLGLRLIDLRILDNCIGVNTHEPAVL